MESYKDMKAEELLGKKRGSSGAWIREDNRR
jgi:hypothetical protein